MVAIVTHPDQKMNKNVPEKVEVLQAKDIKIEASAKETVVERKIDPQTSGAV